MGGNLNVIPPSVIATWPKPNYVDPVTRSWFPAYAGAFQVVATLMVGTRVWLRLTKQAGPVGLDDALLIPAWLAATMFTVLGTLSSENYGIDRHIWDVNPEKFETLVLLAWLSEFAFLLSTCSTKISVLLFYRRLTTGAYHKGWKYATIFAVIFTAVYGLAFMLVLVFNCSPTEAYWKMYDPRWKVDFHCANTAILNPVSGIISVVSDFYSVLLPCMMLRHFDAPKKQKLALNIIFSLGLLVVAAGAVRTYYLSLLGHRYDITWLGLDVFVWSQLEVQLAMICACAPALRVFFREYLSMPFTRAVYSAKSASITRSKHVSQQTDRHPILQRAGSLASGRFSQSTVATGHQRNRSLGVVEDFRADDGFKQPEWESRELEPVKSPAEYEIYNLRNIEKAKSFSRPHYKVPEDVGSALEEWPLPSQSQNPSVYQ